MLADECLEAGSLFARSLHKELARRSLRRELAQRSLRGERARTNLHLESRNARRDIAQRICADKLAGKICAEKLVSIAIADNLAYRSLHGEIAQRTCTEKLAQSTRSMQILTKRRLACTDCAENLPAVGAWFSCPSFCGFALLCSSGGDGRKTRQTERCHREACTAKFMPRKFAQRTCTGNLAQSKASD